MPRFNSDTAEEWTIFVDLVQMSLAGQNVTTGVSVYKCMKKVLKDDTEAEATP